MTSPSKVQGSPHHVPSLQPMKEEEGNLDGLGGSLAGLNIGNYEYNAGDSKVPSNGNISHHSRISSSGSVVGDELSVLSDSLHLGGSTSTGWPNSGLVNDNGQSYVTNAPNKSFSDETDLKNINSSNGTNLESDTQDAPRKRNESIDMFLSRSPSQSLGTEFLKLRKEETLLAVPHLSLESTQTSSTTSSGNGSMHGQSYQNKVRPPPGILQQEPAQNEVSNVGSTLKFGDSSPSCSVTGTTTSSRSVSPSWNQNLHTPSIDSGRRGSIPFHSQPDLTMHQNNASGQGHLRSRINMNLSENRGFSNSNSSLGRYDSNVLDSSYDLKLHDGSVHGTAVNGQPRSGGHTTGAYASRQQPQIVNDLEYQKTVSASISAPSFSIGEVNNGHGNEVNSSMHNGGFNQYQQHHHLQQQQIPEVKPQQQVFYMAVPTQDGQGQVLQPIRMVQLPGQPNAFVLPSNATNAAAPNLVNPNGNLMMQSSSGGLLDHSAKVEPHHLASKNSRLNHNNSMPYDNRVTNGGNGSFGIHGQHRQNPHNGNKSPHHHSNDTMNHQHYERRGFSRDVNEVIPPINSGNMTAATARVNTDRAQSEYSVEQSSLQHDGSMSSSTSNGDFVANLYASPKRPPLKDLLGHVRRLSRDQVGCRLLQQSLDEEGPGAATQILNEGLTFWGEAMVDPFGNYLFQKILEKITAKERVVLIKNVSTRLVNASLNLHGTRSVQKVVELCAIDETSSRSSHAIGETESETAAEVLTRALAPAAARLCIDSHGNHVIQRILLKLPYHYSQFVFDAVASSVGDVARHRHGCCVIQRCLDSPPSAARSNLVRRIVDKALELMQDAYGNYVVQYVLDVCSDEDVHAVCESVVGKVCLLAIQKFSSNVMEKCLERCTDRVRELYLKELSETDRIRELMTDPFGNYVIQRALAVATHSQAVQLVETMRPHLMSTVPVSGSNSASIKNSAGGRRIMAKISRRFPNFNLGNSGLEEHGHRNHGMSSPSRANEYDHHNQYSRPRNRHGSRRLESNGYGMGNNGRYFQM